MSSYKNDKENDNWMETELNKIQECKEIIDETWKFEVALYEQGFKQEFSLNQIDPRIFPYHKQCVRLLDMYAALDGPFEYDLEIDPETLEPPRHLVDEDEHARVDEYLPCSTVSIMNTLMPGYRKRPGLAAFDYLDYWEDGIWKDISDWILECYQHSSYHDAMKGKEDRKLLRHDADNMAMIDEMPKGWRTKVLLKLLKHSMSELQRDHRLTRAVVLSMIDFSSFEGEGGVEAMRFFFITYLSEYIYDCDTNCHDRFLDEQEEDDEMSDTGPSHYCKDYMNLQTTIELTIGHGIKLMTQEHANLLVGFVHHLYDSCGWEEKEHMKELIGYESDDTIRHGDKPLKLLFGIINGLGIKAYIDRCRLKTLLRWKYSTAGCDDPELSKEIYAIAQSHLLSVDALVSIGKTSLIRVPADSLTEFTTSRLVRNLVISSIDLIPHSDFTKSHVLTHHSLQSRFIGHNFTGRNELLTNENRYSESINNAFAIRKRRLLDIKKSFLDSCSTDKLEDDDIIQKIFLSPPSKELQNVVRGLFLSQLVETDYSGCGYGDFLVWCRLPIHIYEPMLYEHIVNYPSNNNDSSDSDDDEFWNQDKRIPYFDEDGNQLSGVRLKAQYDFSLLLLKKVWAEPWKPQNHSSFQPSFREAVWALLLCAHRYHLGSDVPQLVCSFLSRNWWPDDRVTCWRYECEIDNIDNIVYHREDRKPKPMIPCGDCMTAHACSKKHLSLIHREGHRRVCKFPPVRSFTYEDAIFCQDVMCQNIISGENSEQIIDKEEVEDDDDSCWESIESEEGNSDSKSELIYRFFENKAYKMQRTEESPFAAFYNDE